MQARARTNIHTRTRMHTQMRAHKRTYTHGDHTRMCMHPTDEVYLVLLLGQYHKGAIPDEGINPGLQYPLQSRILTLTVHFKSIDEALPADDTGVQLLNSFILVKELIILHGELLIELRHLCLQGLYLIRSGLTRSIRFQQDCAVSLLHQSENTSLYAAWHVQIWLQRVDGHKQCVCHASGFMHFEQIHCESPSASCPAVNRPVRSSGDKYAFSRDSYLGIRMESKHTETWA